MDENRIILIARESSICNGCFFLEKGGYCRSPLEVKCGSCERGDGKRVIWVLEDNNG